MLSQDVRQERYTCERTNLAVFYKTQRQCTYSCVDMLMYGLLSVYQLQFFLIKNYF